MFSYMHTMYFDPILPSSFPLVCLVRSFYNMGYQPIGWMAQGRLLPHF
jgi:hypothetical protein